MDHPGERRRIHDRAVPRIGGIAIAAGLLSGLLLLLAVAPAHWVGPCTAGLLGAALLVGMGLLDDRQPLPAGLRFAGHVLAALILVYGSGAVLTDLGDLFGLGPVLLGPYAIPFTVLSIVGLINAFNLIDGIDGLAGGLALIACALLLGTAPAFAGMQIILLLLSAALIPYLLTNLEIVGGTRYKVFLGDAGSTLLGYLLAWALIEAVTTPGGITPVTAVWLVALPLVDTLGVIARRMISHRSPFTPDGEHLHYLLARLYHSQRKALALLLTLAAVLALMGVVGFMQKLPEAAMFYAAMAIFGLSLLLQIIGWRSYRNALARRSQGPRGDMRAPTRSFVRHQGRSDDAGQNYDLRQKIQKSSQSMAFKKATT